MGIFKFKTALLGLTTVLAASGTIFADATVDGTFDDNQNDFEYYWYYYDDNSGVGKDDRAQNATPGTPSSIDVVSSDSVRHAFGDAADTHVIKKYTFTTGKEGTNSFATMPFTFGTTWKTSWGTAQPFVGIGTQLVEEGKGRDLTGATAVTFKIKSRVGPLSVNFKVQTLDIDVFSNVPASQLTGKEFGYFASLVSVTTAWTPVTVLISDLAYPTWAKKFAFDQTKCTKLAWEVQKEVNLTTTKDTLDIDDIQIVGYTYVSPSMWQNKPPASMTPPVKGKFSNFDDVPFNKCSLGYYWYAYNDAQIGGNSTVTDQSATLDPDTKRLQILFADNSGSGGTGHGAKLDYVLGKAVQQNGNSVQGFVGIGCNVYDSSNSDYFNADSLGVTGLYFHYSTLGDIKKATLEVSDVNDVGDAANPTRKDTRGSGVVMYRDLPYTDGQWVAVSIPFDSLVYHSGWAGSKNIPLNKKKLAKFQWKVQGQEGKGGVIAIDNIYLVGATGVRPILTHSAQGSAFNATYLNGKVNVNWSNTANLTSGKISLVNSLGAVVASAPIAKTGLSFSSKTLPAGMYFVKLNAVNTSGKTVAMQSAISIVK